MRTAVTTIYTITLISMATKMAVSQIGYGYRSWFGRHPRAFEINQMFDQCFPDGTEDKCRRMTDCCSNYCDVLSPHRTICRPNPCGCPQPPWGPINDACWTHWDECYYNEQCCSGYCKTSGEPTRHGGLRRCWPPPCIPCETTYKK